jgi:hypothetical protein
MTQFEQARFNSKANNKKFEENFDRIFRNKKEDTKKEEKK